MPSPVASAFRLRLATEIPEDYAALIDPARGSGPEFREVHRALLLADRALRDWAAAAIAKERPGAQNRFETLKVLAKPEDHHFDGAPAAAAECKAASSPEQTAAAVAAGSVSTSAQEIDTEAPLKTNKPALEATAAAAADVLLACGALLGGPEFVVARANETLGDLVAVNGWKNELGPRFE